MAKWFLNSSLLDTMCFQLFAQAFLDSMSKTLPSKTWSCETLQRGLSIVKALPLTMNSLNEPDVDAMEAELMALLAGVFAKSCSNSC